MKVTVTFDGVPDLDWSKEQLADFAIETYFRRSKIVTITKIEISDKPYKLGNR